MAIVTPAMTAIPIQYLNSLRHIDRLVDPKRCIARLAIDGTRVRDQMALVVAKLGRIHVGVGLRKPPGEPLLGCRSHRTQLHGRLLLGVSVRAVAGLACSIDEEVDAR